MNYELTQFAYQLNKYGANIMKIYIFRSNSQNFYFLIFLI